MKSFFTLSAALLLAGSAALAEPVDEPTARSVAIRFLAGHREAAALAGVPLQLVYHPLKKGTPAQSTLYVYEAGGSAFVIVSGDDALSPLLGYSTESGFGLTNLSPELACWLKGCEKSVSWVMDHHWPATVRTAEKWRQLRSGPLAQTAAKTTGGASTVAQLLTTRWDQSPWYNAQCPFDPAASTRTLTGCTATAMSQIMRFWSYPATGTGSHTYTPTMNPQYGPLTVNFGATTYNWSQMPNQVYSSNPEVARLLYHAGVSVEMEYTPYFSGAWVISYNGALTNVAETALPEHFGYKSSIKGLERDSVERYHNWTALIKMELNGSRPVLYVGYDSAEGHAFVADGYDADDRLHINWGWSGSYNGYFSVDDMDPAPGVTGYSFNLWQEALVGIEPAHGAQKIDLAAALTAPASIRYGEPFALSSVLVNSASAAFAGDYALRVFDTLGNAVDTIQLMSGQNLAAAATTGPLSFACSGSAAMTPGVYWLGLYYRTAGGRWQEAGSTGSFHNRMTMVVEEPLAAGGSPLAGNGIRVFPNPAGDRLSVLTPADASLQLLDLQGRNLLRAAATANQAVQLPLAGIASGLYQLRVQSATGTEVRLVQVRR